MNKLWLLQNYWVLPIMFNFKLLQIFLTANWTFHLSMFITKKNTVFLLLLLKWLCIKEHFYNRVVLTLNLKHYFLLKATCNFEDSNNWWIILGIQMYNKLVILSHFLLKNEGRMKGESRSKTGFEHYFYIHKSIHQIINIKILDIRSVSYKWLFFKRIITW